MDLQKLIDLAERNHCVATIGVLPCDAGGDMIELTLDKHGYRVRKRFSPDDLENGHFDYIADDLSAMIRQID